MLFIRWGRSTGDRGGSGALQSAHSQSKGWAIHWESLLEGKGKESDAVGNVR